MPLTPKPNSAATPANPSPSPSQPRRAGRSSESNSTASRPTNSGVAPTRIPARRRDVLLAVRQGGEGRGDVADRDEHEHDRVGPEGRELAARRRDHDQHRGADRDARPGDQQRLGAVVERDGDQRVRDAPEDRDRDEDRRGRAVHARVPLRTSCRRRRAGAAPCPSTSVLRSRASSPRCRAGRACGPSGGWCPSAAPPRRDEDMSCVEVFERVRDSPLRAFSLFTVRAAISSARDSDAPLLLELFLISSYWRARFVPFFTPRGGMATSLRRWAPVTRWRPAYARAVCARHVAVAGRSHG